MFARVANWLKRLDDPIDSPADDQPVADWGPDGHDLAGLFRPNGDIDLEFAAADGLRHVARMRVERFGSTLDLVPRWPDPRLSQLSNEQAVTIIVERREQIRRGSTFIIAANLRDGMIIVAVPTKLDPARNARRLTVTAPMMVAIEINSDGIERFGRREPATIIDISATGLLFETAAPLEVGFVVEAEFSLPGTVPFLVVARLVRQSHQASPGQFRFGARFTEISVSQHNRLAAFVAAGERPQRPSPVSG